MKKKFKQIIISVSQLEKDQLKSLSLRTDFSKASLAHSFITKEFKPATLPETETNFAVEVSEEDFEILQKLSVKYKISRNKILRNFIWHGLEKNKEFVKQGEVIKTKLDKVQINIYIPSDMKKDFENKVKEFPYTKNEISRLFIPDFHLKNHSINREYNLKDTVPFSFYLNEFYIKDLEKELPYFNNNKTDFFRHIIDYILTLDKL